MRALLQWVTLGALALGLTAPALAQDAGPPPPDEARVLGVYAPRLAFDSGVARSRYAADLAAALTQATGLPFKGRGFASSGAFAEQVAAGKVTVALVDAQVQARRGFTALAQGQQGGRPAAPLVLVVAPGVKGDGLLALKGKRLADVPVDTGDAGFVANFLMQGEVAGEFFKAGRSAHDVQGAVALVKLGKADAAFTPADRTEGLRTVFRSRPVPLPVLVLVDASLPAEQAAALRQAAPRLKVPGPLDGFGAVDSGGLQALRGSLGKPRQREAQPVMVAAPVNLGPVAAFPATARSAQVAEPPGGLAEALGVPEPPAERF
ncbi:MAG: PhnD/SsuA/transferrin family substrate-binding protein [Myxococcales bacterium]|nr:PhnD/SsuA/transferrin family substrate-binding protein [Myxococcales bacterium]MCB9523811.1 PhnD/SsuA/transferrin family substrate-binding protein [Myxococcales bacterium]